MPENEERMKKAMRMYAFINQISHAVVHAREETSLFAEVCEIATAVGGFDLALIVSINQEKQVLNLVAKSWRENKNIESLWPYYEGGLTDRMLKTGKAAIQNGSFQHNLGQFTLENGFQSGIVLPIRKGGEIVYSLYIFCQRDNLFDKDEEELLVKATDDISFTLDARENERLRILAEERLRHSESRLRQAQQIGHFGSWELSFATGVATWSEEACRIYGLEPTNNLQSYETWLSFIHPDDKDRVLAIIGEAQLNFAPTDIEHRITTTAGETKHLRSIAHFEFNTEGKPVGLYGVAHDITNIKQAEEKLQRSKKNLRQIVDLVPQAIFAMNEKGDFVFANKSFADLYGKTPKNLVYKNIADIIPANNSIDGYISDACEIIDSGKSKYVPEIKFTDHQQRQRVFSSTKVPYMLAGGGKAMLGISHEITEDRLAEEERSKMLADIQQRNKDHEQFSYIVSHNLRAPIANIIGLSKLLEGGLAVDNREQLLDGIFTSVKKLDSVIRDLNYVLQVKQHASETKEWLDFQQLVDDIKLSIDNLIQGADADIVCDFTAAPKILTMKSYMYSIFINLVTNSIKYRRPGVKPEMHISSHREGDKLVLVFKDNGMGIDLARRGGQVFGMYKRFHPHVEGKGMGLYLVKIQVETLGGNISVASEVNMGTQFKIIF